MLIVGLTLLMTLAAVIFAVNFHTPEKKIKHELDHDHDVADAQFRREMGSLLGPAIAPGNDVQALHNGDEIFPAMLHAIKSSKLTITFETYIYWSGSIGERFAEALIERAQAGIKAHVMLDWLGSAKVDEALLKRMKAAGVEVERYHALHWYNLGRINNRTHRKVLIIDGSLGFTGGVGIADQWTGAAENPDHWRDVHFRVRGPVIGQTQAAFLDNWIKTTGQVLHGDSYFPDLQPVGGMDMHVFISSPAGGSASMRLMYLTAITAAVRSIDIAAAYFIPDKMMTEELVKALERGVRIRILVPDKHIDSHMVKICSKREWGPLLAGGAEIRNYEPTMLHTKMLIFDRFMVSVGSTNFDPRSFELNDEASLNVYDDEFAQHMTTVFEHDLESSVSYSFEQWQQRSWIQKLAEKVLLPLRSQL